MITQPVEAAVTIEGTIAPDYVAHLTISGPDGLTAQRVYWLPELAEIISGLAENLSAAAPPSSTDPA